MLKQLAKRMRYTRGDAEWRCKRHVYTMLSEVKHTWKNEKEKQKRKRHAH